MELEHGIAFNKPYVSVRDIYANSFSLKNTLKIPGSSYGGTVDTPEVLIPLSVIGDDVFCIAMVSRVSSSPTEYELTSPYPGGMPQANSFFWQETERLAYFTMVNVKEFINLWKLKE